MAKVSPRGIRNNNPGNLRLSADKWQGLSPRQSDHEFFVFADAIYGIRALARTLITYQDKYNLRTINALISRWAPNNENDTGAYIDSVTEYTGFSPVIGLDMHLYEHLRPLVTAIIRHENGMQPYTAAQIDRALALAGVEAKAKPLAKSGTVRGGLVSGLGLAGLEGLDPVADALRSASTQVDQLTPYLDIAKWAALALAIGGLGYILYRRWDDRRRLAR